MWESFEWEGTDANDEPGKSIHWRKICDCESTPTPTPTPTPFVCCGQDSIKFEVGHNVSTQIDTSLGVTVNKFIYNGELCIPVPNNDYCNELITPVTVISPENKNIGTILFYGGVNTDLPIYLSINDSTFAKDNSFSVYDKCFIGYIVDNKCKLRKLRNEPPKY